MPHPAQQVWGKDSSSGCRRRAGDGKYGEQLVARALISMNAHDAASTLAPIVLGDGLAFHVWRHHPETLDMVAIDEH